MRKSASIHARIKPELKEEAEAILKELGLNASQAITLFYQQIRLNRGLPFVLRVPDQDHRADPGRHRRRREPGILPGRRRPV